MLVGMARAGGPHQVDGLRLSPPSQPGLRRLPVLEPHDASGHIHLPVWFSAGLGPDSRWWLDQVALMDGSRVPTLAKP